MRTTAEMELIQEKALELVKLLSKEEPINLGHDPMVKGVIELLMDELNISKERKAAYLYKALGKYI